MTTNKTYTPILIDSVLAAADLQQKRFVGFDGNCCTAGAKALGVVDVTTEKGQECLNIREIENAIIEKLKTSFPEVLVLPFRQPLFTR